MAPGRWKLVGAAGATAAFAVLLAASVPAGCRIVCESGDWGIDCRLAKGPALAYHLDQPK